MLSKLGVAWRLMCRRLPKVLDAICIVLAVLVPTFTLTAVASRYMPVTIPWATEMIRASALPLVMFGAALAFRRSEHVRVTILDNSRRHGVQMISRQTYAWSVVVLGMGMAWLGLSLLRTVQGQSTAMLGLPLSVPYSSVPISGVIIAAIGIRTTWEEIRRGREDGDVMPHD